MNVVNNFYFSIGSIFLCMLYIECLSAPKEMGEGVSPFDSGYSIIISSNTYPLFIFSGKQQPLKAKKSVLLFIKVHESSQICEIFGMVFHRSCID